ncbi:hypothetical protein CEXT_112911 [Caerostris extrusa]|uniref:Uncharacterized protein n=1 Tax=Caerostris extrusa TaxID=172846 RepID=A0AAV4QE08_CAEEX|nr:hypothetical protein CEXT_112911 [Caerostris extrusa]
MTFSRLRDDSEKGQEVNNHVDTPTATTAFLPGRREVCIQANNPEEREQTIPSQGHEVATPSCSPKPKMRNFFAIFSEEKKARKSVFSAGQHSHEK